MNLHGQIMNLLATEPAATYRIGHRDARHAAAELAKIEALTTALQALLTRAEREFSDPIDVPEIKSARAALGLPS